MGAGDDEAVTVNTRALIDKVLARYSGEWTTLRELLQNAADASASKVVVRLETSPSANVPVPQSSDSSAQLKHVLLHHAWSSMIVENNGEVFKDTDWARLKKIAEGNPDETKIGAFGVGFYSVFADCENPLISSGSQTLAFHWQQDALFTRRGGLPDGRSTNTTFFLPMRNQNTPIPSLLSLSQFLVTSLTFVGLEDIELKIDQWTIATFTKKVAPELELPIPKEIKRKTRDGLMNVTKITKEAAQLDARWLKAVEWNFKRLANNAKNASMDSTLKVAQPGQSLRGFFARLAPGASNYAALEKAANEERQTQERLEEDLLGESTATIFFHVNKAKVKTAVASQFSSELERATKKPPPKYTTVSLLSVSYDEQVASATDTGKPSEAPQLFATFVPNNGKGKIFIGFTTNQTTGLNVHVSTPSIIPTVERESIDLNNRFIRSWNIELLRIAGIVARVSWEDEASQLDSKISQFVQGTKRSRANKEDVATVLPEALYLHNTYTWNESTPSAEIGAFMDETFWICNQKTAISTLSTVGIMPSSDVRLATKELAFVEDIPTLPKALAEVGIVERMIDYNLITDVTISDIKASLEKNTLTGTQLQQFLEWLAHKAQVSEIDVVGTRSLLDVAVANDDEDDTGKIIDVGQMKSYLNVSRIPPEMPIPPSTLPFKYTKKIPKMDLESLGFQDLQLVPWLRWLVDNTGGRGDLSADLDLTTSAHFAKSVLPVISKQWDGLSSSSKTTLVELLVSRSVIPTKMGMRKPSEAYFQTVKLFDDLPVIFGLQSVKEKFLSALGVRKTVDIGVVFERLIDSSQAPTTQISKSSAKWSHVDLIKYLASVRSDIPSADIDRLKNMKICPAETEALQASNERYLVSELFEPHQALRQMKLRTMHWPGVYQPESSEGRFLAFLGLRAAPSYIDLIKIMSSAASSQDNTLRDHALKYFIEHHHTRGYAQFDHSSVSLPYLPVQGHEKRAATPITCFSNERAAILGFDILRRDLHGHALKFGVKADPPMSECVKRLMKSPPNSKRNARDVFAYLASRSSDITDRIAETLGDAAIVPVVPRPNERGIGATEKSENLRHIPPRACFLGDGEKYADIFDYVDFGHEANAFLLRIGSKHEPSTIELAKMLIYEPARTFSVLGDTRYLELLRNIAVSWRSVKRDKTVVNDMKNAKCLLAYREVGAKANRTDDNDYEDSGIKSWELASARQLVIVDDIITHNLFKSNLLTAPMEEAIEDFYHSLGSPEVSSLLEETQNIGMIAKDETLAIRLHRLILERSRLFLHSYPPQSIKHDAKWIEQNLKVKCVKSITLRKSLRGYNLSHTQSRTAVINSDKAILYVASSGYDMFEVSQALVPVLLQRSKPEALFMLEMILESSLQKLRSRGYNVTRLLNQKETEARIAEEARKKQLEEEQQEMRIRQEDWEKKRAKKAAEPVLMPGDFPDSPDGKRPSNSRHGETEALPPPPRGFLDGIRKHFPFDRRPSSRILDAAISNGVGIEPHTEAPPPPYQKDAASPQPHSPEPEAATAPHHLQRK